MANKNNQDSSYITKDVNIMQVSSDLPVSFNLPNKNLFLFQAITNCVLGGTKENKIGESTRRNNKKFNRKKRIV